MATAIARCSFVMCPVGGHRRIRAAQAGRSIRGQGVGSHRAPARPGAICARAARKACRRSRGASRESHAAPGRGRQRGRTRPQENPCGEFITGVCEGEARATDPQEDRRRGEGERAQGAAGAQRRGLGQSASPGDAVICQDPSGNTVTVVVSGSLPLGANLNASTVSGAGFLGLRLRSSVTTCRTADRTSCASCPRPNGCTCANLPSTCGRSGPKFRVAKTRTEQPNLWPCVASRACTPCRRPGRPSCAQLQRPSCSRAPCRRACL